MMKFFIQYLKSKILNILVYLAVFGIIFLILSLYRLEAEALLYAFILCTALLIPYVVYKYYRTLKSYRKLNGLLKESIILQKDSLPETGNILENKYQEIIRILDKEKSGISSEFDLKRTDMSDYYTLWAHQIKTPISAMRLLLQSNPDSVSRELEPELFKIEQYVEMVLGYLRLESDTNDFVVKACNIDETVKQSVKKFSKQFILKKISLDYTESGITAVTDEKWTAFIIEQVISNALKYTAKGSISIYAEDKTLCIADTGIGIAAEDLPRIFEKGYTGYNGRTDRKSTGLGLYLCRRVADKLGHKISIESVVSKGTVVKIDFRNYDLVVE